MRRLVSNFRKFRFRAVSFFTEAETKKAALFPIPFPFVSCFPAIGAQRETREGSMIEIQPTIICDTREQTPLSWKRRGEYVLCIHDCYSRCFEDDSKRYMNWRTAMFSAHVCSIGCAVCILGFSLFGTFSWSASAFGMVIALMPYADAIGKRRVEEESFRAKVDPIYKILGFQWLWDRQAMLWKWRKPVSAIGLVAGIIAYFAFGPSSSELAISAFALFAIGGAAIFVAAYLFVILLLCSLRGS